MLYQELQSRRLAVSNSIIYTIALLSSHIKLAGRQMLLFSQPADVTVNEYNTKLNMCHQLKPREQNQISFSTVTFCCHSADLQWTMCFQKKCCIQYKYPLTILKYISMSSERLRTKGHPCEVAAPTTVNNQQETISQTMEMHF